jgi:hypothetical protein
VQAAFGLTADGEGLLLLDKKAKPKTVLSMLRAEAGKAKISLNNGSMRFGVATIDTEVDAALVKFSVNKDAGGALRTKLIEVLKRISYSKVEINVDPSLESEPEDQAPEGQTEEGQSGQTGDTAATDAARPVAEAPPVPDAAALTAELTALARQIGQIPNLDAAGKAGLLKLAGEANAKIKSVDLAGAAGAIGQLKDAMRAALAAGRGAAGTPTAAPPTAAPQTAATQTAATQTAAPTSAPPGTTPAATATPGSPDAAGLRTQLNAAGDRIKALSPPPAAAVTLLRAAVAALQGGDLAAAAAQLASLDTTLTQEETHDPSEPSGAAAFRLAWRDAMGTWDHATGEVAAQLDQLAGALRDSGEEWLERIAEYGLGPMLDGPKAAVMDACLAVRSASDAALPKAVAAAKTALAAFEQHLATDPQVAACEAGEIGVPVAIRGAMDPAVKALTAALAQAPGGH